MNAGPRNVDRYAFQSATIIGDTSATMLSFIGGIKEYNLKTIGPSRNILQINFRRTLKMFEVPHEIHANLGCAINLGDFGATAKEVQYTHKTNRCHFNRALLSTLVDVVVGPKELLRQLDSFVTLMTFYIVLKDKVIEKFIN